MYATFAQAVLAVALVCVATPVGAQQTGDARPPADRAAVYDQRFFLEVVPYLASPLAGRLPDESGPVGIGLGIAPGVRVWRFCALLSASRTWFTSGQRGGLPERRHVLTSYMFGLRYQFPMTDMFVGGLAGYTSDYEINVRDDEGPEYPGVILAAQLGRRWGRLAFSLMPAVYLTPPLDGMYVAAQIAYRIY